MAAAPCAGGRPPGQRCVLLRRQRNSEDAGGPFFAIPNNITPYPRSNVFIAFNSVDNTAAEPFAAPVPRPEFIGARDFTPVR